MIKKRLWIVVMIIIMLVAIMSGRWSRQEPKNLAIGIAYLYEKTDEGIYSITAEIVHLSGTNESGATGGQSGSLSIIRNFKGPTVSETVRDTEVKVEKVFYGSQNRVRFFSEELAREDGILDILDFFVRDHIADERPYLFVVKNEKPTDIFEADLGGSARLGEHIHHIAGKRQDTVLTTTFVNTLKFVREYYCEGMQPVISVVEAKETEAAYKTPGMEDEPKKTELVFEGLGVMKGAKLVGLLSEREAMTYTLLREDIKGAHTSIPVGEKEIGVKLSNSRPKIKTSYENGRVKINIDLKLKLSVSENETEYDVSQYRDIKILENIANNHFRKEIESTIAKIQREYKSDIFGFGMHFHVQQKHDLWESIKEEWDDKYFAEADITVKVDSKIVFSGETREKFGVNAR